MNNQIIKIAEKYDVKVNKDDNTYLYDSEARNKIIKKLERSESKQENYKRYMVFACDDYYPMPNLSNVCFDTNEKDKALDIVSIMFNDNVCVFDRIDGVEIYSNGV